jgi:glycosyltransferase involved in cell wall biosynthesis
MNASHPLVSVVLSVYNGEEYLRESINSILSQTQKDFEFLIIDDASLDGSVDVVTSFNDSRIRLIRNEENLGLVGSLNKGLAEAKGKYIARMDHDDIADPVRFEMQVTFLELNPNVAVLGTGYKIIGKSDQDVVYQTNHQEIRWKQLYECHMLHPSVFLRREVIEVNNFRYDNRFKHCEDYELWSRISQEYEIANLPDILMQYRLLETSITHKHGQEQKEHSISVRKSLFNYLGLKEINREEVFLFERAAYRDFTLTYTELTVLSNLYKRILQCNAKSNYFETSFLRGKLSDIWYHQCANHSKFGYSIYSLFKTIPALTNCQRADVKIKLLIKAILRK